MNTSIRIQIHDNSVALISVAIAVGTLAVNRARAAVLEVIRNLE